jgi:GxxExxY protein
MNKEQLDQLGSIILDSCIHVHRELGPGLLESAYTKALIRELSLRGLSLAYSHPVELSYKGEPLGKVYVIDIFVENEIILEIKSVDNLDPIFTAQLITYLKITGKKLGYLINFNTPLIKQGFKRVVHNI